MKDDTMKTIPVLIEYNSYVDTELEIIVSYHEYNSYADA